MFHADSFLPIGDVMLAQKIGLEASEADVLAVASKSTPSSCHLRQAD
ncbi:hypothetical protein [Bradyrhizobium zhanjiangense]|nr:hypothetical protein [Bradyrhizobium zhanjiangense]